MVIADFEKVEKETIENLRFPEGDVLKDSRKIRERHTDLERAMALGNLEHSKIRIYFEDEHSCKMVETTVWGVTDKRVILKQAVGIPIRRIHSVEL